MKKPTFSKNLLAVLILLLSLQSFGQVLQTFAKRYDVNVKGDILVIGNNILNRDYGTTGNRANDSYDDLGSASVYNESIDLKWINVDPDGGNNINSSSANLSIPSASQACYEIAYAGLYWSGTYTTANRSAITTVRLKTPTTGYKTLTGTVIYDYTGLGPAPGNVVNTANSARNPYACFVDITAEVKAAKEGTYTLANIASSEGGRGTSAGHSAGWSIFVIYVDPKLPSKYITSYDGFTRIKSGDPAFTFPINGFKTIPSGSVKAKFAFAALEGDNKDSGDAMTIKGNTIAGSATGRLYCALRPASTGTTNFFNSTINDGDAYFLNRNPKSKNTFGYDTGVLDLPNSGNTVIKNNETGADITLSTSSDWYYLFFTALAVEVIEPKVVLTKIVQDAARADIGGQTVALGTALYYEIGYKNVGNDNVGTVDKNGNTYTCVLKDVLPENVNFNLADIDLSNSGGATLKSYDAATRTLLFNIPNTSLTANGATEYKIRLKVQVVSDCSELKNACTNSIDNSADITYVGVYNKAIVNDLSLNSYSGCSFTPKASNFLVNVAPCVYKQEIPYCGNQITIVAKSGYQSYSWSSSPTGTPVLQSGPSNTYTTSTPGTYYVNDITNIVPCKSIQEEIKVTDIKAIPNPILEYAKAPYRGTIDICTIGGKELPKFFLCGATDHRQIITNYGLGSTALWQKLDENSCATPVALPGKECANENPSCQWNTVGTDKDFDAKDAGQYKVTFSFAGGCALVYYFNVYKNDLNPTVEKENEFCTTKGYIKIKNVPSTGYEFSLDSGTFQDSPDFLSVAAGNHNVQIRLKAAGAASCDFTINNIDITKNAMAVAVNNLVHPKCSTDKGSFTVQAQNVRGPYTFELYLGATLVQSATVSGTGGFNSYDFIGKDPGNYTLITKTSDGCYDSRPVIINAPAVFTATANITKALTCVDGEITVTTNGGVPKYYYFVNSTTVSQNTPTIAVTNPGGTYNITVRDGNDCKYDIPAITVTGTPKPVYTVKPTNILCYGSNTGVITFDVTSNTGAYILKYSIDGGANYYDNPVFSNLVANTVYSPKLKYTLNGVDCIDTLPNITLTQPATALTASAGVSELAGCGPNKEGKIRITNPQGGTPFPAPNYYLYSFDDQGTWVTTNDAYKAPGTYTVYIKDANGCIYPMPGITIDPEPVAPIIGSAPVIVYGCDGKATSTVTVTNPASAIYDYTYSIDGTLNTPPTSNVFNGVTAGDHTIRVNYILKSVSTFSNLLNENFGYGDDTTSPGINTAFYCFERQVAATQCKGSTAINDGDYSVTAFIVNPFGAWIQSGDHTAPTSPVTPKGRSLVVNIGDQIATSDILYQKVINNIIPNQPINFEFYAKNLLKTGNTQVDADLRVALVDAAGNEISWFATGGIPKTQNWEKYPNTAITLDPGANTTLKFIVRSNKRETSGNDVAIDDIRVYQLPKACVNYKDISVKISDNQGFSAQVTGSSNISCATETDGTITISAQNFDTTAGFDYSKDGITWLHSTTSPVTLTNLGAGTYAPQVRFNAAGACTLTLPSKTIIAPNPIVVSTTQTLATCFPSGGATIDATGTIGGTGAYTIKLRNTVSPFTITNFPASGILTNVAPGSYTVLVTDAKGCTPTTNPTITIAQPATPTASIDPTSTLCFDPTTGANIVVRVTGGVGPYTYKSIYNGGTPSASSSTFAGPTFTYIATVTGTYSFEVYGANGCKATTISQVISDKLTARTTVLPGLDCDVAPGNEAVIKGTISGGTAPFVVTLLPSGSSVTSSGTTFTYSTAVAGTYNFQIKDANNCVTTIDGTINSLVPVTGSVTKAVDPTCFDGTDGQIQLSGGGGSGSGYEFNFNGAGFSTTSLYTGLNAKTTTATTTVYSYQIKDSNGCLSTTYNVTLNNPAKVVASASIPANTTCLTTTVITAGGAGGSGGYTYSFNGSTTYTGTKTLSVTLIATAQTITYSVKDSKGCADTKTIIIPAYNPPTGINFSTPATITCLANTTSISLTPVAGVAPFTFTIISGATGNTSGDSTGIYTGLLPGNYVFEVKDANGCTKQASTTIGAAATIAVSGAKTDEKCFGANDGTATFTVTGFNTTNNYTVTIKNSLGTSFVGTPNASDKILLTGLAAETYTIVVKDNVTGCSSTPVSVTVAAATKITITGVTASNVNCGQSISNIVVTATGGVTSYKYAYVIAGSGMPAATAFSTANTTINTGATQSNLSWDVYIMDQNDCPAGPFLRSIIRDASPSVKSPAPAALCFKSPSTTALDLTTFFNLGTGTHTYTVNGTASGSTYNITGSGTYTIIVKDANACPATATYVVKPELTIAATRVKDLDCISDAEITFVASGGTNTYSTYEVQFNGTGSWTAVTSPYKPSVAGDYQFRVTDNAACTAVSNTINVTAKTTPTFNHNETPVSCTGGSNGVINITNPTGIAPFTYLIKKGVTTVSTTATASGLASGTYDILLTDNKGCTATAQVILANPTALSATVNKTPLSCGTNNATVDATVSVTLPSGGTNTGFQYSFNGGAFSTTSTYTFSTSTGGSVTVDMRDSNNCTQVLTTQVIAGLNPPTLEPITGTTIYCAPAAKTTSTVTVVATAGTGVGTLTYDIVSGPITTNTTGDANGVYTGLTTGNYVFKVTDDNDCTATQSYFVKPLVSITGSLVSQVDVKCNGASTGSAKITVSGYTGTYTAALTAGAGTVTPTGSTVDVTGLVQGSYTLRLTDGVTGCTNDVVFTIAEPAALTLALTSNKNANCNQLLSKVTVTAGGGKAPYSYAYISTTPAPPAAGLYTLNKNTADLDSAIATTWYVWVKDANGCETALAPVTIAKDTDIAITKPALQCFNGTAFNITLSGTGKAPFVHKVNGTVIPNDIDIVSGLPVDTATYSVTASGKYTLSITDANNCSATVDYIVEKQLFATATLNKDITCNPATGASVTVQITNGTAPFSYQVYNGATAVGLPVIGIATSTFTESTLLTTAGNYTFVISDSNSVVCSVTTNIIPVTATKTVDGTFVEANPICATDNTGKLTLTATVGDGPFEFSIDNEVTYIKTNLSSYVFSNLTAGTYECFIKDSRGCVKHVQKTLIDPPKVDFTPISVNITCLGTTPGTIEVTDVTGAGGTGGTATVGGTGGVFDYYLSNNFGYTDSFHAATGENHTFTITEYGIYTIKVVDANGCSTSQKVTLASPPNDLTIDVNSFTSDCSTGGKAEVKVSVSTPSTSYSFAIATSVTFPYAVPASYQGPDTPGGLISTFINLIPGVTYTFVVRDNINGCYYLKTAQQPVSPLPSLTSTIGTITDVTCTSSLTGEVEFTYNNLNAGTTDVKYQLYDSLTNTIIPGKNGTDDIALLPPPNTHIFSGLAAGKYYIVFTELDASATIVCQNSSTIFEIKQSDVLLNITASSSKNDNTCSVAGLVTGIAKDGTAPYNYAIAKVGDPQPTSFGSANSFYVDSGDWNVYVKDAFGCIQKSNPVPVGLDPAPSITSVTPSGPCYAGIPINVAVVAGATTIGPITYSVDNGAIIGAYSSVSTFNLTPGSYIFNVKDGNGCVASTTTALVINDQLTLSQTDFKILDCKTSPLTNGSVTVTALGGNSTTYSYTITAPASAIGNISGATSGVFTDLDAGNYTFEVSDGTCKAITTATVDVLNKVTPVIANVSTPLCVGADGTVEVTATGGVGSYEYKQGASGVYSTTNIFSQAAGTVTYYVKDENECEYTVDATVTDPIPVTIANIATVQMLCGGGNLPTNATITVTAAGGTTDYEYSFDGGANYSQNNVLTTTIDGTYNIIVRDSNGCTSGVAVSRTINKLDPPVITGFTKTQMTCPALTSDVTINHTNGIFTVITPLAFNIVSGPTMNTTGDATGTYTGLAAGDYMFRITDNNGCIAEKLFTVPTVPTLQLVPQVVANVNCNGGATGSATFTASGLFAAGAFAYSIATTPGGLPFTDSVSGDVVTLAGLVKGQYDVTITDNTTLCPITKSVTITEPALVLGINAVASNVNCNDAVSQLTMTPTGGTPNYTYSIVQNGAGAGTYSNSTSIDTATLTNGIVVGLGMTWLVDVHIKDANNCTAMNTIMITKDVTPTVATTALATNQCTAAGNYTFTATGTGVAPLSFSIDGGANFFTSAGTTYTFTVPAPTGASQAYTVTVEDKNGCTATSPTQTTVYKPLTLNVVQDKDITCGALPITGAQFTLTAGDGNNAVLGYKYAVRIGGVGVFTSIPSNIYTTSAPGIYEFQVTDDNTCTVTSAVFNVTVPDNPAIISTPITQAILCKGGTATMQVNVDATIGLAPYTITVTSKLPLAPVTLTQVSNASAVFASLYAGDYTITVIDAKGCSTVIDPFTISEPAALTASVDPFLPKTACDVATVVTVVGSGGTPTATGYYYNFNNEGYTTTNTYTVNDDGTRVDQQFTYSVKDANGCETAPVTISIPALDKPTDLDFSATLIYCNPIAKRTSTVTLTPTNGFGTLSYTILPSLPVGVTQPFDNEFAGLLPGDYTFKVTDSNGCSYEELYTVKDVVKIDADGQLIAGAACKNDANGKVTFTVSGVGTLGFTHTITGVSAPGAVAQVGNTFELTNLVSGTYQIDVTDTETGCTDTFSVFVPEPAVLGVGYVTLKNATCKLGTTIKATAIDGTSGYTYAFVKAGDPVVYSSSDTAILDPAFSWTVWAKDAHNCETSKAITIITDPMPQIDSVTATQCPSATGYDITVMASSGVGTLEYSLDGISFQSSTNVLKVTSPGNYTVTVRDANKCIITASAPVTILKPLILLGDVSKVRSCSVVNDGEITLTAYDGSGNYEYSKDGTTFVSGSLANIFGGFGAGTHTLYVHDLDSSGTVICTKSVDVIIDAPTNVTGMVLTPINVTCKGGNDGSITVALAPSTLTVNNNPAYNYSLTGTTINGVAVTRVNQLAKVFDSLEAGTYTVITTSSRGCQDTKTITIGEPAIIVVPTPNVVQYACSTSTASNTMNLASITVNNVTGGSRPYFYEFVKGTTIVQSRSTSNVYNQTDLSGGTITVNVYDNKGCLGTAVAAPITPFVSIDFGATAVTVTKAIDCNTGENIRVNVTTTGTTVPMPTLIYTVKDIVGAVYGGVYNRNNTTGLFTGLPVGNYLVTVTNPVTGCSLEQMHYVNNPNTFDLTIDNIVDVSCLNGTNGSAKVTFVDKYTGDGNQAGGFTYTLVDALGNSLPGGTSATAGPINLTGLAAGTYTITAGLTSLPSCSVSKAFTITGPTAALKISETHTAVTCVTGNNDGTISATAIGGWPGGYEFQLESLAGTPIKAWGSVSVFTGLIAGDYIVKVRDSKVCTDQVQVTLVNPAPIVATIAVDKTTLSCFGDTDAVITVNQPVTGGSGVYNYTLEATYADGTVTQDGPQSSNVFINLGAGSYKVIVTDTWTCSGVSNILIINQPNVVKASLVQTSVQTCLRPATVTLSVVGGTGPYIYSTDPNFTTVSPQFANSTLITIPFTTVAVNPIFYVKDVNGCMSYSSNSVSVAPLEPLEFEFENDAPYISCFGDNDGQITAIAKGGSGNYIYTLLNSSGNPIIPTPIQPSAGHFVQLAPGDYLMDVTSGDCRIARKPITITQPNSPLIYTPVVTDVTCNGNGDGKLVLTASGGTGIIKYALSPDLDKFVEDGTFLNLEVGFYKAIIQDVRGCNHVYDFEIKEPNPIDAKVDPLSIKQELCAGEKTGEFVVGITGGVGPYSTVLDDPNGTYVLNQVTFTGLSGGNHTVYIKDANSCTSELIVPLDPAVVLNPEAKVSTDCVNDLPANKVTVTIDDSNNAADVKYSLDSAGSEQDSNVFTNLTPGDHFIMVHHKNGCVDATDTFTIEDIKPLSLSIELGELNQIVATATGGSGKYQFTLNGEQVSSVTKWVYFRSGNYLVTMTDSNGCSISATKYFEFIDIKIPPIFTPTGDGTNDNWKPTNTENYPDIKFVVYDRYGREVGTFGAGQGWDGKYNGTELPMGDYWYVLKLRHTQDEREFIGHFTLYR